MGKDFEKRSKFVIYIREAHKEKWKRWIKSLDHDPNVEPLLMPGRKRDRVSIAITRLWMEDLVKKELNDNQEEEEDLDST